MNLNNILVLPSKPKSMKFNVRSVQELQKEVVHLDRQTKEVEKRLEELRDRMREEKEERGKMRVSHWSSAQPKRLTQLSQRSKMNKENTVQRVPLDKIKLRVLKHEDEPEQAETSPKSEGSGKKLTLRGKVCGQCEVQLAGLMCSECGEDYCVGCFTRFHQKGALKNHRMVPIQPELQTPVSSRDVFGRLQQWGRGEEIQLSPGADERQATTHIAPWERPEPTAEQQINHSQVLFVNDGYYVEDAGAGEEKDSSLLKGSFDEEESARSFQEALNEWRGRGQQGNPLQPASAQPVSVMETQTEDSPQLFVHVEFKENGLNYMEKLLLKKHRRGEIGIIKPSVEGQMEQWTSSHAEMEELSHKLTAERMELHEYFSSIFTNSPASDAGKMDSPSESCLSIVDMDELSKDPGLHRSVKLENDSKMFASVGNESVRARDEAASSCLASEEAEELFRDQNAPLEIFPQPQKPIPPTVLKSQSSPLLQIRSQRPSITSMSSEEILQKKSSSPRRDNLNSPKPGKLDYPKPQAGSSTPRNKSRNSQQNLFPSYMRTKFNPSQEGCDYTIFPSLSPCESPFIFMQKPSLKAPSDNLASFDPIQSNNSGLDAEPVLTHQSSDPDSPSPSKASVKPFFKQAPLSRTSSADCINKPLLINYTEGSPQTTALFLQLYKSDTEEMSSEDDSLVPSEEDSLVLNEEDSLVLSEEDSSDEKLKQIADWKDKRSFSPPNPTMASVTQQSEDNSLEPSPIPGSSQVFHVPNQSKEKKRYLKANFAKTPEKEQMLRESSPDEADISSPMRSVGTPHPGSVSPRLSRAAQEIEDVQTVEMVEYLDRCDDEAEDEELMALACLEEEFRHM